MVQYQVLYQRYSWRAPQEVKVTKCSNQWQEIRFTTTERLEQLDPKEFWNTSEESKILRETNASETMGRFRSLVQKMWQIQSAKMHSWIATPYHWLSKWFHYSIIGLYEVLY